ncbi:MAG: DUF3667 domain-containing protein [Saprospiraceae bacterium]|nr:DUF3667 domain-containing protein [Saprospiraceae bacterium]
MSDKTISQTFSSMDIECNNCGHADRGVYCSNCGGHLKKQRISVGNLLSSIVDFFSNFEDKYVHTFISLTTQPTNFINHYLNGVRDKYYIPFKYFFLNLSINFFVYTYFNISTINENDFETEASNLLQLKSDAVFDGIINDYGSFFSLMIIPLYVLATSVLFRKSTHNMAERATAITFLFGHLMIFQAALNLMSAVFNPFYEFQKYFVVGAEIAIIFLLSLRFFKASMIESIWKSILITVFLFMSMQYILIGTHTILQLYYGE